MVIIGTLMLHHYSICLVFFMKLNTSECSSNLNVGLQHVVPSTNTKFVQLLLPTEVGIPCTNFYKHGASYSSLHSYFSVQLSSTSPFLPTDKKRKFVQFLHLQFKMLNFIISTSSFPLRLILDFSALHIKTRQKLQNSKGYTESPEFSPAYFREKVCRYKFVVN